MRKSELIHLIAEQTGLSKVDVIVILEQFFKEIKKQLAKGETLHVRGFGSFMTRKRAKKIGQHIKLKIPIEIPEQTIPIFRTSQELLDIVKIGKIPDEETSPKGIFIDDDYYGYDDSDMDNVI